MSALTDALIARQERAVGAPLDYLRTVADASTAAVVKLGAFAPLAAHRQRTPPIVWHLARLGATEVQDCGTCVQIVVNQARAEGVPASILHGVLSGDESRLDDAERLALRYGRGIAARDGARTLVDEVRDWFGPEILVELALAVATCQVFPILKRGLGQDLACAVVTVEVPGAL